MIWRYNASTLSSPDKKPRPMVIRGTISMEYKSLGVLQKIDLREIMNIAALQKGLKEVCENEFKKTKHVVAAHKSSIIWE